MGTVILKAMLNVLSNNPTLLESVVEAFFTWLRDELKAANAARPAVG